MVLGGVCRKWNLNNSVNRSQRRLFHEAHFKKSRLLIPKQRVLSARTLIPPTSALFLNEHAGLVLVMDGSNSVATILCSQEETKVERNVNIKH